MNIFSRMPKRMLLSVTTLLVAVVSMTGVAFALQGDTRPTKAYEGPGTAGFDHVTFNSFTGVPNIGDERNFFHGKITAAEGGFYDPMNGVRAGDEILMRVYVHNGADPKHNASGQGVAKNTRVRVVLPNTTSQMHAPQAFVSADNAQPKTIEDTLTINGEYPVQLEYVDNSATIKTNFQDVAVDDNALFSSTGALIGDDNVNGTMKGCFEYVALVTFKVKVKAPSWTLEKKVRVNGTQTFTKEVTAQPGQKVDYVLAFKNVGSTNLSNVVMGDRLPKDTTYVTGSTEWNSGHTDNKWTKTNDNVVDGGLNIGAYAPNAAGYVRFTAKLPEADKLQCGINKIVNTGYVKPEGQGTIQDTATVLVEKKCADQPTPAKPTAATPTPTVLPSTGPAEAFGVFTAVTAAGSVAHQVVSRRRR